MKADAERPYIVFGFETTHDALTAEAAFAGAGLPLTVMPTPKILGALCGIALRVAEDDAPVAERILAEAGIESSGSVRILDR
ncbi:MAG: DUF3343 domain-containing protein [Coriobacteriia bacterium]|nr:DUF3343 domain-containing protein [Coriobacteriia bacterium]